MASHELPFAQTCPPAALEWSLPFLWVQHCPQVQVGSPVPGHRLVSVTGHSLIEYNRKPTKHYKKELTFKAAGFLARFVLQRETPQAKQDSLCLNMHFRMLTRGQSQSFARPQLLFPQLPAPHTLRNCPLAWCGKYL